jgi:hypothetical protein
MPLVFVLVALLFWVTVVTVVALRNVSRSALRWLAALGHGPYASSRHSAQR